jgi:hypothetical protein
VKTTLPWFRFYTDAIEDPKVQRLPPHLFKTWVNLLCLAGRAGGPLPCVDDMAFYLRLSAHEAQQHLDELILAGLIDIMPDGARQPHNWSVRQYVSDSSAERVRKHRAKRADEACNVTGDVTVTPPDSDSETDSEGLTPLTPLAKTVADAPVATAGVWPDERPGEVGVGVASASRKPLRPETLAAAARALGVADVTPLLGAFERWPKSRKARDRDAMFLATAATLLENAKPWIRAACGQVAGPEPPAPARHVAPSPELVAALRGARQ